MITDIVERSIVNLSPQLFSANYYAHLVRQLACVQIRRGISITVSEAVHWPFKTSITALHFPPSFLPSEPASLSIPTFLPHP